MPKSIGTTVNSVLVFAIVLTENGLFGTEGQEEWAAVQVVDYRNRIKLRPAPTDGTNIVDWHPELYSMYPGMTEKELSPIVWEKLNDVVNDGSIINNTASFSSRMNASPNLKQLESVSSHKAASLINNLGNFSRISDTIKVLDIGGYILLVIPRLFYFIMTALNKLSIRFPIRGRIYR